MENFIFRYSVRFASVQLLKLSEKRIKVLWMDKSWWINKTLSSIYCIVILVIDIFKIYDFQILTSLFVIRMILRIHTNKIMKSDN